MRQVNFLETICIFGMVLAYKPKVFIRLGAESPFEVFDKFSEPFTFRGH